MIILGHSLIKNEEFKVVDTLDSIDKDTSVNYAIKIDTIKDVIFANALNVKYIIVNKQNAQAIQKIANEYLFDSRIIVTIKSEDEIEELANLGIDGVLFD